MRYGQWLLSAMVTVLYLYIFVLGLGLGYQLVGDGCSWDVPKIDEVVKERVLEEKK